MNIIEKAKELGSMIAESEEMKAFKESEVILANDEKGKNLFNSLYGMQEEMSNLMQMENSESAIEGLKKKYVDAQNELLEYEITANYLSAKSRLDGLMKKINDVIAFSITGEEPCSDEGCSSCGCGCGN